MAELRASGVLPGVEEVTFTDVTARGALAAAAGPVAS